ncbi:MAG: hypothetical protein AAGG09_06520 [Pseudomonadota bacterium]
MPDLSNDTRLAESKAVPMEDVLARLGITWLRGHGAERVGPCPVCGGHEKRDSDRFAVNLRSHLALCRQCGLRAGDQVGLVQAVLGIGFREALKWLMGEADVSFDPQEIERRRARARKAAQKQAEEEERHRRSAIAHAERIWRAAEPATSPVLRAYLIGRGFHPSVANNLYKTVRFIGDHPYVRKLGGSNVTLHRGPAMIARIATRDAPVSAVHMTWIDPTNPGQKAVISERSDDNGGKLWPAKLVRGSAKGGVIALNDRRAGPIVLAEGIETTLTALQRDYVEGAAYWCGVSLGNIGDPMQRVPGLRWSGIPDMSDRRALVMPDWCTHLMLIEDGDSDPKMTRAKLESGARRSMARVPGLTAQIVPAGKGVDLNDLIRPKHPEGEQ